jgi:membrane-associated phospholipid phosphatase
LDNALQNFNTNYFYKINKQWANTFFDFIMPLLRESMIWIPLYLFLIIFAIKNFGKQGLYWTIAAAVTVILSNFISSDILKPMYDLPRPCRDANLEPSAILRISRCPGSGGFTSSHATNHFALATFIFLTIKHIAVWVRWFFVWAFSIGYAQVYVGVHFPIDIIGGTLVGVTIAIFTAFIFNSINGLLKLKPVNNTTPL